jgi:DNA-directed RNA polymerase subunit D
MELEVRKLTDEEMEFLLSGADPAFANALRRAMLREVPIMAIDEVEFTVNDSAVYDEVLAHRLALIPLRTPEGYSLPGECGCKEGRCPKCSVTFQLKCEGPAVVMSGDLKSSDEEVKPVRDSIPILRLAEGQHVQLTAIARLGFGREHAKWQPGLVTYKYMPVFELDEGACDGCGTCIRSCPRNLLQLVEDKPKIIDVERCSMCRACAEACPRKAIGVSGDPTRFLFRVESTGALPPERILLKALDALEDKCREFVKKVKKL